MKHGRARKQGRPFAEILSLSVLQTEQVGNALGRLLDSPSVVLLRGALGAGKTTLARGLAGGLGLKDLTDVRSPSYALVHVYQGRVPIYHLDLYRLEGDRDLYSTGLDEFLNVEGVSIVEWGERLPFPVETALSVDIDCAGEGERLLRISCPGIRTALRKKFREELDKISADRDEAPRKTMQSELKRRA